MTSLHNKSSFTLPADSISFHHHTSVSTATPRGNTRVTRNNKQKRT